MPQFSYLPDDYIEFLRGSNGAEGKIGNAYLALFSIKEVLERNRRLNVGERAPGLLLFASDRASEMYCFDFRREQLRVSVINMMDIGFEEPRYRSDTFTGLLQFLASSDDPWSDPTPPADDGH